MACGGGEECAEPTETATFVAAGAAGSALTSVRAYARERSNCRANRITAFFTLPENCNVARNRPDYINFYLGMGDRHEAGVSFSYKHKKWVAFFHAGAGFENYFPPLGRSQTVTMSLERKATGQVIFTINGVPHDAPGGLRLPQSAKTRVVNAAEYYDPAHPAAHSLARWTGIQVWGGMSKPDPPVREVIVDSPDPFSSRLGAASKPCDPAGQGW